MLQVTTKRNEDIVISGSEVDLIELRNQITDMLRRGDISLTKSFPEFKTDGTVESIWVRVEKK